MDTNPQQPQENAQSNAPVPPAPLEQPQTPPQNMPQPLAPQTPIDIAKTTKVGWALFVLSIVVTGVGLFFGYALAASAIIAAIAGRLGLQVKNKPLAITSIAFCILTLAFFTISKFA